MLKNRVDVAHIIWGRITVNDAASGAHRLGIAIALRGRRETLLADETTVIVIRLESSEVISIHAIDPTRS